MPRSADALINPALLKWARESAGMSIEEASQRLRVSEDRLRSWEAGTALLTVKQLWKVANLYKQSFAAFYLSEAPPVFYPPLKDYRRLPGGAPGRPSAELYVDVRAALDRRAVALELLEDATETPLTFELSASLSSDPEELGIRLRQSLSVETPQQLLWRDPRIAFNNWREAIEQTGVLVFQSKSVPLSTMRGYSVSLTPLPIIVVNRKDSYAGRSFTLLHELVHLTLRTSGVCDLDPRVGRPEEEERMEIFCNHVAGTALVPKQALLEQELVAGHHGHTWRDEELQELAGLFAVSREVVLRRLLMTGKTDEAFYREKRDQFAEEYATRPRPRGFVTPPVDVVSLSGKVFVRLVLEAFYSERITLSDASEFLGIKLGHLQEVTNTVAGTYGA
jgi:Zn-dependent peptidase ImmA (M78 family)